MAPKGLPLPPPLSKQTIAYTQLSMTSSTVPPIFDAILAVRQCVDSPKICIWTDTN